MSTIASQSAHSACHEKARRINEILEAHKRIASLQIEKMEAVVAGRVEGDAPWQLKLDQARELRDSLMEGLRQHIVEHRC